MPYSIEALDKLLTESLKKNIPASGLHLFGINQLEEEDMTTSKLKDFWFCFKLRLYQLFYLGAP